MSSFTDTKNYTHLQEELDLSWAARKIFASAINLIDVEMGKIVTTIEDQVLCSCQNVVVLGDG